METILTRLATNSTEQTALASWELALRGPLSVAWAIVLAVVLSAIAVFVYRIERGKLTWLRVGTLSVCRIALFGVLLLLLLGPIVQVELRDERPRPVVLLVDNSQSLQQQDRRLRVEDQVRVAIANGLLPVGTSPAAGAEVPERTPKDPARIDVLRAVLSNPELRLGDVFARLGPVRPMLFGSALHGPGGGDDSGDPVKRVLDSLRANDDRTALADAIHEVLQGREGDLPAAIVVMTDGLDTASKFRLDEVAHTCRDLGVPLHIYGVGTPEGGSLQLREVGVPETIFFDDTIHVPVRWRARGLSQGTVEITLTLAGKVVAKKHVPLRLGEDLREVLSFTPEQTPGKKGAENHDLVASIRLKEDKSFADSTKRTVRVIDSKVKVLYIEGAPRWEYKFLQSILLRDRRVEAHFLLAGADARVLEAGPPFIPAFPAGATGGKFDPRPFYEAKYNLIILGDIPADYLSKDQLELIGKFVQNRGGLIVIAGRQHMPGAFAKTPLAELLPVEFRPGKLPLNPDERTQEFLPKLTAFGENMDMLSLADTPEDNVKVWQGLAGFHWHYPVTKLRPGAIPLLVHPFARMLEEDKSESVPMPILAQQYFGNGQVVFLASDEVWRWRLNTQDKHYARFWGQLVYQLGLPHLLGENSQRVQMALDRSEAVLGRPGKLFVRLLDKNFSPRTDPRVQATLKCLDAKDNRNVQKLVLLPVDKGVYQTHLEHNRPGRFEVTVNNPEPATFSYRVQLPPQHELEESGMAEAPLRQAAQVSGGRFYREEDLHRMAEQIRPQAASFSWRDTLDLSPLLLVLFVGLITVEWVLRKLSDLS